MENKLKLQWQATTNLISELLCETKQVVQQCSVGTLAHDLRLGVIRTAKAREIIPQNLELPIWFLNEKKREVEEFVMKIAMSEHAMRQMFRSVWDTAFNIKTLATAFIDNPNLMSTRNMLSIQRDLLEKTIDIPFVQRKDKGRQYLDHYCYVEVPEQMHQLFKDIWNPNELYKQIEHPIRMLLDVKRMCKKYGVTQRDSEKTDLILMHIQNLEQTLKEIVSSQTSTIPTIPSNELETIVESLGAIFVEAYCPEKKKPPKKDWAIERLETRLEEGLLHYTVEGYYDFESIEMRTNDVKIMFQSLPSIRRNHHKHVHDVFKNPTYTRQGWEENEIDNNQWQMLMHTIVAIYVSASHFYDCAGIMDKIENLRKILKEHLSNDVFKS